MIRKPGDLPSIVSPQQSGGCPDKEPKLTKDAADRCMLAASSDGECDQNSVTVSIVVCDSCRFQGASDVEPRPGTLLAQATAAAAAARTARFSVRQVSCLANCKRGLSAALIRDGAWSYVFGGLDIANAADLVTAAEMFDGSPDGLLPFRDRPECLKRGLVARVPPLDFVKEVP